MLCERGAGILCEEWTYPSALAVSLWSSFSTLEHALTSPLAGRLAIRLLSRPSSYGRRRYDT